MSGPTNRRRIDVALELLQTITQKKGYEGKDVVVLRTSDGKWRALFDKPDLREAGSTARREKLEAFPTIEAALMHLVVHPDS